MLKATISFSILIVISMLAAAEVRADGEVYRWVDEDGVVHFDQQPGDHKEAVQVTVQPDGQSATGDNPSTPIYPTQPSEPSLAQQQREERAEKRQEAAELRAATEQACAQARQRVETLEPSPRVMVKNEDGSVSRMDDEERLELLEDAKAFIARNCDS